MVWLAAQALYLLQRLSVPREARAHAISFLLHIIVLKRLPARQLLFNDVFYRVKTGGALHTPLAQTITDKELSKVFINGTLGGQHHAVPTLAVLHSVNEIDSFAFPARCCIKPTHASGEVIIRENGEALDKERIAGWLNLNYAQGSGEANYANLTPKVIVEPLVFDTADPIDYKIHCVDGKAKLIEAVTGRGALRSSHILDTAWNELPFASSWPLLEKPIIQPANLPAMIEVAEKLAQKFFLVRIDLYSDGRQILVGEITNCTDGALAKFDPLEGEIIASQVMFSDVGEDRWQHFFNSSPYSA